MGLKEKAIEMSEIYRQNPKVEAIVLAGSVARKLEDEHSDVELHILWSAPLEDEDRKGPINHNRRTITFSRTPCSRIKYC